MAKTIRLTIDGQTVEVPQGTTILRAAQALGMEIPHPELTPVGICRLGVVEANGSVLTPCYHEVEEGYEEKKAFPSGGQSLHPLRAGAVRPVWQVRAGLRGGSGPKRFGLRPPRFSAQVSTGLDRPLTEAGCELCRQCLAVCPIGVLTEKDRRFQDREEEV